MLKLKYWCMKAVCSPSGKHGAIASVPSPLGEMPPDTAIRQGDVVLCPHDMNPRFPDTDKQIHFDFSCRVVTDVGRNILGIKRLWDKHIYIELGKRA